MSFSYPAGLSISRDEYIERLWTELEVTLPQATLQGSLQEAWPNANAIVHWPAAQHWPQGTDCADVFRWLGAQHGKGYEWLYTTFRILSRYERKGGGLYPDAPAVPAGLRPREGVEMGCGKQDCSACYEPDETTTSDPAYPFLSPDYLLLRTAYERLHQLAQKEDMALVQAMKERLDELMPAGAALDPLTARLFLCELCGGPLQVVREASMCETIAIDQRTGQLIWASELLADEREPPFEIQDALVCCVHCQLVSSRVGYHRQQARLTIKCCMCQNWFFLEEGEEVLADVQGRPLPVCSPDCRESLVCEP